jgi:hypothetical protein
MLAQFEDGMQRKKSQLLIVDRGEDLAAPLVHELSYQCAVYDFLDSKLDGDVCVDSIRFLFAFSEATVNVSFIHSLGSVIYSLIGVSHLFTRWGQSFIHSLGSVIYSLIGVIHSFTHWVQSFIHSLGSKMMPPM